MRYIVFLFLWIASCGLTVAAQNENEVDSSAIVTNSVWSNWFGQLGIDMSLQNPYGCNFAHVFPNEKSFGIDGAFGKWFTPEYGVRGKLNLENVFLQNDHAEWVNMFDKGYLTLTGDFLIDLQNFLGEYKPDRIWTLTLYPRAGAFINLGKGNVSGGQVSDISIN